MSLTPEEIAALPYRPCVGVALVNRDGLVFTGERIDTPGAWQMPQGGIDAGEEPFRAALRELWEETGVRESRVQFLRATQDWLTYDLPEHLLGKVWKGKYRGQRQLWYAFQFLGEDSDVTIAVEHPEFARWRWATATQLVNDIVPFKKAIYESVAAEFSDLLAA